MSSTVSAAYASFSGGSSLRLSSVPSSAEERVVLIYDLSGYSITSLSTSVSFRGTCRFDGDIDVQTQIYIYTATINSSDGTASLGNFVAEEYDDWQIPANSSATQSTSASASITREFGENTGIAIEFVAALPDITGGTASATISPMPQLMVEGTSSGGGGGGGSSSSPSSDPVSATPSSPNSNSSIQAGTSVSFSWSLQKYRDLDFSNYIGSLLQYRYGSDGEITNLGTAEYDLSTLVYDAGFNPNTTVQWRVIVAIDATAEELEAVGYVVNDLLNAGYQFQDGLFFSKWSEWKSFRVGDYPPEEVHDVSISLTTPSGGTRNGSEPIPFAFTISTKAEHTEWEAQYSVNDGVSWLALNSGTTDGSADVTFTASGFPAGEIKWQVRAKANGDYCNWAKTSFTVSYDGYGAIVVTSGPINVGIRANRSLTVQAGLELIGETGAALSLSEAQFCWRAGEGSNYSSVDMTVSGDTASIVLPAYYFPYGLIQWYLAGKDSKGTSSETEIYSAYILQSSIDSFPLHPVSVIHNTDDSIEFKWAYIAADTRKPQRAEIQFSVDGVNWASTVPISFDQDD